ncbi:N-acetylmuramoyl-L-alanine amidase [Brevibacillus brevis]|uniref:N-acetylmuramoyl-L-alanine amidase n=1 Tax=Brevibacillus brevis TaxID=1393 RepID=A0A517I5B4_BREBE|nr:N-acetylmuramoyl-L-alanine amidase [Brevibacillus brevis]QDS34062.1 N-acetylmuramoyl-L-alanine amidase [Brevibacillus brevis]
MISDKKFIYIAMLVLFMVIFVFLYNHPDNSNASQVDSPVYKIVIDPGHGGKDHGAEGVSGRVEKDFTLQLARKVQELAEQDSRIEVYLTRSDDRFLSSKERERPQFANQLGADLFISLHGNTYTDPTVSGTETYYFHPESLLLAESIQKHVRDATGFQDRGVKKGDFFVVKDTNMPAVLLEVGYLTNPSDEQKLFEEDFQYRIAASVIEGIQDYLGTTENT